MSEEAKKEEAPKKVIEYIVDYLKMMPGLVWDMGEEVTEGYIPLAEASLTCKDPAGANFAYFIYDEHRLKPVSIELGETRGLVLGFKVLNDEKVDIAYYKLTELDDFFPEILEVLQEKYLEFMKTSIPEEKQWSTMRSLFVVNEYIRERASENNTLLKTINAMLARGQEKEELEMREKVYNENVNYGAF